MVAGQFTDQGFGVGIALSHALSTYLASAASIQSLESKSPMVVNKVEDTAVQCFFYISGLFLTPHLLRFLRNCLFGTTCNSDRQSSSA